MAKCSCCSSLCSSFGAENSPSAVSHDESILRRDDSVRLCVAPCVWRNCSIIMLPVRRAECHHRVLLRSPCIFCICCSLCVWGTLEVYLQLSHSTHNSISFQARYYRLSNAELWYYTTTVCAVHSGYQCDKRWEVTSHKYFASVLKQNFKVLYFTSVFICLTCFFCTTNFFISDLVMSTLQRLYDLFNAFEGSFYFTSLNTLEHQIDLSLNEGNSNTWKTMLLVYFI